MRRSRDQWIAVEAGVPRGVGNDHGVFKKKRMTAERVLQRDGADSQPGLRHEELPVGIDEVDDADRRAANLGCDTCQIVEIALSLGVEDVIRVKRLGTLCFAPRMDSSQDIAMGTQDSSASR